MRMNKTGISLLLIMALLSTLVFAQETNTSEDNEEFIRKVGMLSAFGVFRDVSIGNPTDTISRVEFFKVISNVLGINVSYQTNKVNFTDMPTDQSDINAINAMVDMGYVRGFADGTILPYQSIKYEEAIQILVSVLGYDPVIKGSYPMNYMLKSEQLGILKNAAGYISYPVTTGTLTQMLFNTLEISMMVKTYLHEEGYEVSKGTTILSTYLKLEKRAGRVTGNEFTHLNEEIHYRPNRISIDDVEYDTKYNYNELLGYLVTYYIAKDAAENTLVYAETKGQSNEVVNLSYDSTKTITYLNRVYRYEDENSNKAKEYAVELGANIIINGRMVSSYSNSDMLPEYGDIKLIDSNNNGGFETVIITGYTDFVVNNIDHNLGIIYDKYDKEKKLNLSLNNSSCYTDIKDKKGKSVSIKKIAVNDILSVSQSRDGIITNIIWNNETAEGEVTEYYNNSGDSMSIVMDDKTYCLSNHIRKNDAFKVGNFIKVYFNKIGEVIIIEKANRTKLLKYAYLIDAKIIDKGVLKPIEVKLYDETDKMLILKFAKRVTINGESFSTSTGIIEKLEVDGTVVSRPIIYKQNDVGEIVQMELPAGLGEKTNKFRMTYSSGNTKRLYRGPQMNFSGVATISSKTMVFKIPSNPKTAEEKEFLASGNSYFRHDYRYVVEAYATSEHSIIADILVTKQDDESYDSEIGVLMKLSNVYVESEDKVALRMTIGTSGSVKEIYSFDGKVRPESVSPGDVIYFRKNDRNELINYSILVNSDSNTQTLTFNNPSNGDYEGYDRYIYASVYDRQDNVIAVTTGDVTANSIQTESHNASGYKLYAVGYKGNEVVVETVGQDRIYDYRHYGELYSNIFAYTRYGDPRIMVIYEK